MNCKLIVFFAISIANLGAQQVTVNFGSRTAGHVVPSHLFGAERMTSLRTTGDLELVKAGGINYARFYANIPIVFKTKTPNWGSIDSAVQRISAGGVHVMLQMVQTPPWLQPKSGCTLTAVPTNMTAWGQMAAQYVKHMDSKFPGVVTDYEIWNEPNTTAFCAPPASRLSEYMKLYNIAAPLMRAQIRADGSTAKVGGPDTAGMQTTWVQAMLADPIASKNIDFMSYHDYMFNNKELGATWAEVYQKTQNSGAGPGPVYRHAESLIAAGKQPQGKNLPIYNSEYNLNWDFAKNCCSNDPVFSPVWNSLYVSDVLNSVYSGASNSIGHMVYFAATAHPYFCLVGELDANMDCNYPVGRTPQAYPQYYLYQLLGATQYLGLQNGGHMAVAVSPTVQGDGLVTTAFYTSTSDAVVLTNANSSTYSNVKLTLSNTGFTSAQATLYTIIKGSGIHSTSLSLTAQGGTTYTTTVTLEPHSVQAIRIE